jgi:hypothetical protein
MNIEDAIRSLGATNAASLFPVGNPEDPNFDIHAHLEETMDLLNAHMPLPPAPTDPTVYNLAQHDRRTEAIQKQRILTIKNKMTGTAKRLVKAEPDATFATMEDTHAWLV